jgi:DNA-binding response OmpR family regulator
MRILIVDDDPLAGELAAAVLEEAGHDCLLAENGVAALEQLAADAAISLVVTDLNMPLVSGIDLFTTMREQADERPVVLLSGDDPDPLRAAHPGLAGVLAKDATLEQTLPALIAGLD